MDKNLKTYCEMIVGAINSASKEISFNEETHTYTNQKNEIYYSVTTVLQQLTRYKFDQVPEAMMMHKARIGSMVHYFGELLFKQKVPPTIQEYLTQVDPLHLGDELYYQEVKGYHQAMVNYGQYLNLNPNFIMFASEIKVVDNEQRLAGISDNLRCNLFLKAGATEPEYQFIISDYKTSSVIDEFVQPLQLYAYALMINNLLGMYIFTHGVLVQLKKDGTFKEYGFHLANYARNGQILFENWNINIRPLLENKK